MTLITEIRQLLRKSRVMWRAHAQERMLERNISREDVLQVVSNGEIIENYETGKPFPSYLIYGQVDSKVLHVVLAWDKSQAMIYVITVYEPSIEHFKPDFKTRKD